LRAVFSKRIEPYRTVGSKISDIETGIESFFSVVIAGSQQVHFLTSKIVVLYRESESLVEFVLKSGINYIDTAPWYL
jgi:aryl-alcohol dehydrogenase-like predicted oxidoreductase